MPPEQPPEQVNGPRRRFDTLFTDPRHFRGDCVLLRTAVRRGWLADEPQAVRDELRDRILKAIDAPEMANLGDSKRDRAILTHCRTLVAMVNTDLRDYQRATRYVWGDDWTDQTTGRPRNRWHVSDYPNRIDANAIRRRATADGTDLRNLHSIELVPADKPDQPGEWVALAVAADKRCGWRLWLVCPRCRERRVHLYPRQSGLRCRKCARIAY